ncbi:amidohydrolase family protein [bacterium]|nr:amidohydrolase family protein [bacterium]
MKLIRQVRALQGDLDSRWDILFDRQIQAIAPRIEAGPEQELIDGSSLLLLSQVIDPHVHFNDPGYTHHEDFAHGTRAAARGGITTVFDMPCTAVPPVTSGEILEARIRHVASRAYVDFAFWGGIHAAMCHDEEAVANAIKGMAAAGAIGLKVYLTSAMPAFPALSVAQLHLVMQLARNHHLRVAVHAEEPTLIQRLEMRARNRRLNTPAAYAAHRPALVEATAIAQVIEVAFDTGAAVHIVHLSSARGLELIDRARSEGLDITVETCPHYLAFTAADLDQIGSALKTAPVVKDAEDREALWNGLIDGRIDFVATDHASCDFAREKNSGDIWQDYSGMPGVETMLSYLYEAGLQKRGLSLKWLQRVTSTAAQRAFKLPLGDLRPGQPATFTLIDSNSPWLVDPQQFASRGKYSPFAGHTFPASVKMTFLNGAPVFDGVTVADPPGGSFQAGGFS